MFLCRLFAHSISAVLFGAQNSAVSSMQNLLCQHNYFVQKSKFNTFSLAEYEKFSVLISRKFVTKLNVNKTVVNIITNYLENKAECRAAGRVDGTKPTNQCIMHQCLSLFL